VTGSLIGTVAANETENPSKSLTASSQAILTSAMTEAEDLGGKARHAVRLAAYGLNAYAAELLARADPIERKGANRVRTIRNY
jgi:hypothetical protein